MTPNAVLHLTVVKVSLGRKNLVTTGGDPGEWAKLGEHGEPGLSVI